METLLKLGIDWQSVLMYLVNFGILYVLVAKYLVPRIVGSLDARQKTIENSLEEANRLKDSFQEKLEAMEKEKEEAHQHLASEMQEMKKTLDQKRSELAEEMDEKRRQMLADTEAEINERKEMLFREAEEQTLEMIKKMVLFIVQNKIPEDVVQQSVQDAWKEYKK